MEDDPKSALSLVPYRVLYNEDIRVYTHCSIEKLGSSQMLSLYNNWLSDGSLRLKPEFRDLESKGFTQLIKFLMFYE